MCVQATKRKAPTPSNASPNLRSAIHAVSSRLHDFEAAHATEMATAVESASTAEEEAEFDPNDVAPGNTVRRSHAPELSSSEEEMQGEQLCIRLHAMSRTSYATTRYLHIA